MNKLLTATILTLTSTAASGHSGHLSYESVHGFLHAEHIIMLLVIGFIAYFVKTSGNK